MSELIRPPFSYIGAKTKLLEWLYSFFPPHSTFVDVFGGSGVVTFNKSPSCTEIYNDINGRIVNFYKVIRNKYAREVLTDLIDLTPYGRKEFFDSLEPSEDPIEDARRFYVKQNQCYSAIGMTFGFDKGKANTPVKRFYKRIRNSGLLQRLQNITFENLPFERIFELYDTEQTLFYCDPPYVDTADYETHGVSYSAVEHNKLLDCLLKIKGYAMLSNYENDLNKRLLDAGWRLEKKKFVCLINHHENNSKSSERVECLYLSPRVVENQLQPLLF